MWGFSVVSVLNKSQEFQEDFFHVWCQQCDCPAGQEQAGYVAEVEGIGHGESQAETQPCPFQLHWSLQRSRPPHCPVRIRSLISQPGETTLLLLTRHDPILGLQINKRQPTFPEAHLVIVQHDN